MKFTLVESFLNETLVTIQDLIHPVLWSNNKLRSDMKRIVELASKELSI